MDLEIDEVDGDTMLETYEVSWCEATRKGAIVVRRRAFRTEKARVAYVARICEKDSFVEILAYCNPYKDERPAGWVER